MSPAAARPVSVDTRSGRRPRARYRSSPSRTSVALKIGPDRVVQKERIVLPQLVVPQVGQIVIEDRLVGPRSSPWPETRRWNSAASRARRRPPARSTTRSLRSFLAVRAPSSAHPRPRSLPVLGSRIEAGRGGLRGLVHGVAQRHNHHLVPGSDRWPISARPRPCGQFRRLDAQRFTSLRNSFQPRCANEVQTDERPSPASARPAA